MGAEAVVEGAPEGSAEGDHGSAREVGGPSLRGRARGGSRGGAEGGGPQGHAKRGHPAHQQLDAKKGVVSESRRAKLEIWRTDAREGRR